MKIDEKTKVIARLHTKPSPRGLNIYNPFFEKTGINAVYLLFYNPDPKPLINSLRELNFAGAITAGFESDERLPKLLDELDEAAGYVGRIGFLVNKNGVLRGYYQGGDGLLRTIQSVTDIENKKIVIVGAGNVVKSLLFNMRLRQRLPREVRVFNRTLEKAVQLKEDFSFVSEANSLEKLASAKGDIIVNATHIGGSAEDNLFNEKIVANFSVVCDLTFEKEKTNLASLAEKLGKKYTTGWDMFTYQAQVILEEMLDRAIPLEPLRQCVYEGLSQTVA